MHNKQDERLWTAPYVFLMFLGTLTSVGFNMVHPTLAKYAVSIGASLTLAGIVSGLFAITAMVARPFSGVLADQLNKKRLMVIATTVIGVAALGYSISFTLPVLIGFRILHGVAFAVSSTVNVTLLAGILPRTRMGEGIGYYGLGQIVSSAFGPGLGLAIGDQYGFRAAYLVSAMFILTSAALMTRINFKHVKVSRFSNKIRFSDLISIQVLPLAFIGGIFSLLNGVVSSFLVLLGDERGIAGIGLQFTVNAIALFLIRPLAGRLSDRKGLSFILYPALILAAVSAAMLGSASSIWMILGAGVLRAVSQGSAQPSIQTACLRRLPPEKSGVATSTFYIGADVGQGIGPVIGGAVSAAWGYGAMFYGCAGLFIVGVVAYRLFRIKNPVL